MSTSELEGAVSKLIDVVLILIFLFCKLLLANIRARERLYFINRHFADLAELRDITRLIIVMVKNPYEL